MKYAMLILFAIPWAADAQHGTTDAFGATAAGEVRISAEQAPPGGTVQLKFLHTEPKPILSGTKAIGMDPFLFSTLLGVSVYSPAGDAFGVGSFSGGQLRLKAISPSASYGTVVDYPLVTVAARINPAAIPGSMSTVTLQSGSVFTDATGKVWPFIPKPGITTAAGSLFVHNVSPGGGTWPAGTVVRVIGGGFAPDTKVRTKFKTSSVTVVSASEIRIVLGENVQMDSQPLEVINKDGASVEYFSYLRATPVGASTIPAVASAEIAFPVVAANGAVLFQQGPGFNGSLLTALAMENANSAPASVTLQAWSGTQLVGRATAALPAGSKIVRELGEFFAAKLPPGTTVRVASTLPLRYVGFTADARTGDVTPFVVIRH